MHDPAFERHPRGHAAATGDNGSLAQFRPKLGLRCTAESEVRQKREKFINGAEFVAPNIPKKQWSRIVLRIRRADIIEIDAIVEHRMGWTRTSWILQAIEEKLYTDLKG